MKVTRAYRGARARCECATWGTHAHRQQIQSLIDIVHHIYTHNKGAREAACELGHARGPWRQLKHALPSLSLSLTLSLPVPSPLCLLLHATQYTLRVSLLQSSLLFPPQCRKAQEMCKRAKARAKGNLGDHSGILWHLHAPAFTAGTASTVHPFCNIHPPRNVPLT